VGNSRRAGASAGLRRQRGVYALMFAMALIPMIGFLALALDVGQIHNRSAELQGVADAAALAAVRELDGTAAGVASAVQKAQAAAANFKYKYQTDVVLSADSVRFSTAAAPDTWLAQAATGTGGDVLFVKVQTDASLGAVDTALMRVLSASLSQFVTSATAMARRPLQLTPLAVCALDKANPIAPRPSPAGNELVEFGFRRGVSYNLLSLDAAGNTQHFVVDPVDPPGVVGDLAHTEPNLLSPFVCSGSMPMLSLANNTQITVRRPFPIASLFNQLNSRFDLYVGGACNVHTAPPDRNIKQYTATATGTTINWMSPSPVQQTATAYADPVSGLTKTVADISLNPVPAITILKANYGPLWTYSKPVKYATAEPYTSFQLTNLPSLYQEDKNVAGTWTLSAGVTAAASPSPPYPTSSPDLPAGSSRIAPYISTAGGNFSAPSATDRPGLRDRRVLNIPLLECPITAASDQNVLAKVLAIGQFFMAVQASGSTLSGEFAGVVKAQAVAGRPELYQ
jgi:Flp pilus assembly protein TadG